MYEACFALELFGLPVPSVVQEAVATSSNRDSRRATRSDAQHDLLTMSIRRNVLHAITAVATLMLAACGGNDPMPVPPAGPTPTPTPPPNVLVTANAYILPDAVALGPLAFGEPPMIIYKGERLRWVNLDKTTHAIVADTSGVPDFVETGTLPLLGERSSVMTATGTTTFHCTIHPGMVGTLIVRER